MHHAQRRTCLAFHPPSERAAHSSRLCPLRLPREGHDPVLRLAVRDGAGCACPLGKAGTGLPPVTKLMSNSSAQHSTWRILSLSWYDATFICLRHPFGLNDAVLLTYVLTYTSCSILFVRLVFVFMRRCCHFSTSVNSRGWFHLGICTRSSVITATATLTSARERRRMRLCASAKPAPASAAACVERCQTQAVRPRYIRLMVGANSDTGSLETSLAGPFPTFFGVQHLVLVDVIDTQY